MSLSLRRQTDSEKASTALQREKQAAGIWTDALSKLTSSILWWRIIALVLAVGCVYFGHVAIKAKEQVKVVAFIDRIDTEGKLLWAGRAETYEPNDLFIAKAVVKWLVQVRTRPGDVRKPGNLAILNANWKEAYALTDPTSEAGMELSKYIDEENPTKYQADVKVTVDVDVIDRYRRSEMDTPKDHTYRLEWREEWKINGTVKQNPRWQADVWVELRPDQRKGQTQAMTQGAVNAREQPGVYIVRYDWRKLGGV